MIYWAVLISITHLSFAASFLTESRQGIKMGEKFLGSMVRDRLEKISELGNDWSDKPVSHDQQDCSMTLIKLFNLERLAAMDLRGRGQ